MDSTGDDDTVGLKGDDKIVFEARKQFRRNMDRESDCHKWFREDTRFVNADARNGYQWPDRIYMDRNNDQRPCLTINKTRTHCRIVINEAMQNKTAIKIRPTGGIATYEASQAMQAIVSRIEYISNAEKSAYGNAIKHQVEGGFGYATLETRYISDRSFAQDIFINKVRDPCTVILDCEAKEATGLDANNGFIFEHVLCEEFYKANPRFKGKIGQTTLGFDDAVWFDKDHLQRAMYYVRRGEKDEFISYVTEDGRQIETMASEIEQKELADLLIDQIDNGQVDGRHREVINQTVLWHMIAGDKIIQRGKWAGKYIPIIRLIGEEVLIDGKLDRKGLTRYLIDQQRSYNYNASGQVEFGALQNRVPYTGAAEAFEGQEQWKDANTKNYAFLQFNHLDAEGKPLPPEAYPRRQEPPQSAGTYAEGMKDAQEQMMMASGQYQAQMGENENAKSGRAINERQRQGDTATYHFIEHQGDFFRAIGVQLLDLIPKIYDTERKLHVLGEDGTKRWLMIKPDSEQAIRELKQEGEEAAILEFNPQIGEYECQADPGPSYATRRQEAWNALSMLVQQSTGLMAVAGDLLMQYGDFEGADQLMERLRREIQATKPYLFADVENPALLTMQQQVQKLQTLNSNLVQKLAELQLKIKGKEELRDVEVYRAETDRMGTIAKMPGSPQELESMVRQLVMDALNTHITGVIQANQADLTEGASA